MKINEINPNKLANSLEAEVREIIAVGMLWHTIFVRGDQSDLPSSYALGSCRSILHWSLLRDFIVGVGKILEKHSSGKYQQASLSMGIEVMAFLGKDQEVLVAQSDLDSLRKIYEAELGIARDKRVAHADILYCMGDAKVPSYAVDLLEDIPTRLIDLTERICLSLGSPSHTISLEEGKWAAADLLRRCAAAEPGLTPPA